MPPSPVRPLMYVLDLAFVLVCMLPVLESPQLGGECHLDVIDPWWSFEESMLEMLLGDPVLFAVEVLHDVADLACQLL